MVVIPRNRIDVIVVAGAVVIALAGCGGSTHATRKAGSEPSGREKTKTADLFAVGEDCQRYGASAMLEGSGGTDTSAVPDDTSAVCGCWIKWMAESLPPSVVIQMYASIVEPGYIPVTMKGIGGIVGALQSCDLGHRPRSESASSTDTEVEDNAASSAASTSTKSSPTTSTQEQASSTAAPSTSTTAKEMDYCQVEQGVQSLTPFPHITDLTISQTKCSTANDVASRFKTEWAAYNRFPTGGFYTSKAAGEQRFQCKYQAASHEGPTLATCDGPRGTVVTMRLGS
jgi:hypothetical protein